MNAQNQWLQARAAYGRNPTAANRARAYRAWNAFRGGQGAESPIMLQPEDLASTGLRGCHLTADQMSGFDDRENWVVREMPRWNRRRRGGLGSVIDEILNALSLRDPIATDYPGLTLQQVWTAVSTDIDEYKRKLPGLRSDKERARLAGRLDSMYRIATDIRPAFQFPDSQIGSNERKKLVDLVLSRDSYIADWRKQKAIYGYADPQTGIVEGGPAPAPAPAAPPPTVFVQVPVPTPAEIPWGMIGLGVLAAAGLGLAIGGRKK